SDRGPARARQRRDSARELGGGPALLHRGLRAARDRWGGSQSAAGGTGVFCDSGPRLAPVTIPKGFAVFPSLVLALGLSTALAGAPRGQNLFIAGDGFTLDQAMAEAEAQRTPR